MDDGAAAAAVAEPIPAADPDVLISYCTKIDPSNPNDRRGEEAMLALARQLKRARIACYHGLMAGGGQDWQVEWFGRVRTARAVILMLSSAYFASEACVREPRAVLRSERLQGRILLVIVGDGVREALHGDFAIGETPDGSRAREFIREQITLCGNWVPPPREGLFRNNDEAHGKEVIQWFRGIHSAQHPRDGRRPAQSPNNEFDAWRFNEVGSRNIRWTVVTMIALLAIVIGHVLQERPSDMSMREDNSGPSSAPSVLPSTLSRGTPQPTQETSVVTQSRLTSTNIPVVSEFFTGREKELAQISFALNDRGVCGIVAAGGMGKTQLMAKYAEDHLDDYSSEHVHWIVANNTKELAQGLANIAKGFGTPSANPDDVTVSANAAILALAKHSSVKWLLCVDNADDRGQTDPNGISVVGHLAVFLAKLRRATGKDFAGQMVVTSRFGDESVWHRLGASTEGKTLIRLGPLGPESAAEVLMRYKLGVSKTENVTSRILALRSDDRDALQTLAGSTKAYSLGGLPLALQQAGAYIARYQKSFSQYLHEYKSQFEANTAWNVLPEVGSDEGLETHQRSVHTTWLLNINQLSPDAERVLNAAAVLHPDFIPDILLRNLVVEVTGKTDSNTFDKLVLDELVNWSMLLTPRTELASHRVGPITGVSMHRVLRSFVIHRSSQLMWPLAEANLDVLASFQRYCDSGHVIRKLRRKGYGSVSGEKRRFITSACMRNVTRVSTVILSYIEERRAISEDEVLNAYETLRALRSLFQDLLIGLAIAVNGAKFFEFLDPTTTRTLGYVFVLNNTLFPTAISISKMSILAHVLLSCLLTKLKFQDLQFRRVLRHAAMLLILRASLAIFIVLLMCVTAKDPRHVMAAVAVSLNLVSI